ncbi:MAG: hypothetical protein AABY22_33500 [Nanoarchaeota archaeon]
MEANKIKDLINFKNYFRYFKKGIAIGLLTGASAWVISYIIKLVNKGVPIQLEDISSFSSVGTTLLITLVVGWIAYGIISGFLVEFVNNSSSKIIKLVNK